jgi:hypothetical protein
MLGPHRGLGLSCAASAYSFWDGGNQWAGYHAWLTFFRDVVHLPIDWSAYAPYEALGHVGPRLMHAEFCLVSDRPVRLLVDAQSRPHSDDGPFCAWRDGTALWAWHGVRVPPQVILAPQTLTAEQIAAEPNQEVRRVMIERVGWPRYLEMSGATPRHCDRYGDLYRLPWGDEEIGLVVVTNSTPEPDGSLKKYGLTVPLECTTAHAAVASTFGLTPREYAPRQET